MTHDTQSKSTSIIASGLGGIQDVKQNMVVTTLADLLREDQAQSLT